MFYLRLDFNGTPLYVTEGSATSYDSMVPAYLHGMRLTRDRKKTRKFTGGGMFSGSDFVKRNNFILSIVEVE